MRKWVDEQEARQRYRDYVANKQRMALAKALNPSGIPEKHGRYQALDSRMRALQAAGPMYPDGQMPPQSDIKSGPGLLRDSPSPKYIPRPHTIPLDRERNWNKPRKIGLFDNWVDPREYWQQHGFLGGLEQAGLLPPQKPSLIRDVVTQSEQPTQEPSLIRDVVTQPEQPTTGGWENEFAYIEEGFGLPEGTLYSLMMAETEAYPSSRDTVQSDAGAIGAFQLTPIVYDDTMYGPVDPTNRHQSAMAAAQEIKRSLNKHDGDMDKALAEYNYGAGRFKKLDYNLQRVPKETKQHRERFHKYFDKIQSGVGYAPAPTSFIPTQEQYALPDVAHTPQPQPAVQVPTTPIDSPVMQQRIPGVLSRQAQPVAYNTQPTPQPTYGHAGGMIPDMETAVRYSQWLQKQARRNRV